MKIPLHHFRIDSIYFIEKDSLTNSFKTVLNLRKVEMYRNDKEVHMNFT